MPRGVPKAGKRRKPGVNPDETVSTDAPVKKKRASSRPQVAPQNIFGDKNGVFDQIKAKADLAEILKKHLTAMAIDLDKFDKHVGHTFGKQIKTKVTQAAITEITKFDFNESLKPRKDFFANQEKKIGADS